MYARWRAGEGPRRFKFGHKTLIREDHLREWMDGFELVAPDRHKCATRGQSALDE
jgi:hypothetical protein